MSFSPVHGRRKWCTRGSPLDVVLPALPKVTAECAPRTRIDDVPVSDSMLVVTGRSCCCALLVSDSCVLTASCRTLSCPRLCAASVCPTRRHAGKKRVSLVNPRSEHLVCLCAVLVSDSSVLSRSFEIVVCSFACWSAVLACAAVSD